jgi:hypothetical protein
VGKGICLYTERILLRLSQTVSDIIARSKSVE